MKLFAVIAGGFALTFAAACSSDESTKPAFSAGDPPSEKNDAAAENAKANIETDDEANRTATRNEAGGTAQDDGSSNETDQGNASGPDSNEQDDSSYALKIEIPKLIKKVDINPSTGPSQNCNTDCTKSFKKGTEIDLSATLKDAENSYTSHEMGPWSGDCTASDDKACSISMDGDKTARIGATLTATYTASQSGDNSLLRNSVYFYDKGELDRPGLPAKCEHRKDGNCIDAVHIRDTSTNREHVCKSLVDGIVMDYRTTTPSYDGWVAGYQNGYYNLKISTRSGQGWDRLCHDGKDCYDANLTYLTNIECKKEY